MQRCNISNTIAFDMSTSQYGYTLTTNFGRFPQTISVLCIGAGGGTNQTNYEVAGGGGAGDISWSYVKLTQNVTFTINVGPGVGNNATINGGYNGYSSSIASSIYNVTCLGGGASYGGKNAASGGSGGGGGIQGTTSSGTAWLKGNAGTGYNVKAGGSGYQVYAQGPTYYATGGGGGAGGVGVSAIYAGGIPGNGGPGIAPSINGLKNTIYCGGGAGSSSNLAAGGSGIGAGNNSGTNTNATNYGSGGARRYNNVGYASYQGLVIFSFPNSSIT